LGAVAAWLVRGGRDGELEEAALAEGAILLRWTAMPDLTPVTDRPELADLVRATYPLEPDGTLRSWVGQLWAVRARMAIGDEVVLPRKGEPVAALGHITGPYEHRGNVHLRRVAWADHVARDDLPPTWRRALRYVPATVCQLR
jgi:restriction system protein